MRWLVRLSLNPGLRRLWSHRFLKFGAVGFLGTVVNLLVLYLNQEIWLRGIHPEDRRLSFSLAGAIFLATIHNFLWNRYWTWGDRKGKLRHGFFVQLGQYFLASWLSILLQFLLTKVLARWTHYLAANIAAIVLAAVVTYVLNDIWTFALQKPSPAATRPDEKREPLPLRRQRI